MNHKEIEYKYWAGDLMSKEVFTQNLEGYLTEQKRQIPKCTYVVSCDDYYVAPQGPDGEFVRHRKGGTGQRLGQELTIKRKEGENVVRVEVNLDVSSNDVSTVVAFLALAGYKREFQVFKEAWIRNFEDCDVSFYTLADGRSVIELEAIGYSSVAGGVAIIDRWEANLALDDLQREPRSLYEIFTDEIMDEYLKERGLMRPVS